MPRTLSQSPASPASSSSRAGTSKGSSGAVTASDFDCGASGGQSDDALALRVQAGDNAAAEVLLQRHRGMLYQIARRALPRAHGYLELEDLLQEARLGFLRGVKRFDVGRGVKLMTYVGYWAWQAVGRAVETQADIIAVPRCAKARGVRAPVVGSLEFETTENGDVLADVLAGPDDTEAEVLGQIAAEETLAQLDPGEQRLVLAMAAGFSALEVAEMDGANYQGLLRQRRKLRAKVA